MTPSVRFPSNVIRMVRMIMSGPEIGPEFCRNGRADVIERPGDALELWSVEVPENALQAVLLDRLHGIECLAPARGEMNQHDAPVVGHSLALDEATLVHPADDPGCIAHRDVEEISHMAHVQRAVVLKQPQHVHVRHAHAGLHQAASSGAAESRDHVVDRGGEVSRVRIGAWIGCVRVDSLHEVNNLAVNNQRVKQAVSMAANGGSSCVSH